MAEAYERKGDLESAVQYYLKQQDNSLRGSLSEEALWFDPPTRTAVQALDRIRVLYEPRIEQVRRFAESRPQDMEAQFQLGYLYDILGLYDPAIVQYEIAARIDPRHPYPHVNLGHIFMKKRAYHRAIQEYQNALALGAPDPPDLYNFIGICHKNLFDFNRAEEAFKKAIELAPSFYDPYVNLAAVYEIKREKGKAAEILERGKTITMRSGYSHGQ